MALASPGRADEAAVLDRTHPLQSGQVGEGGLRDGGLRYLELLEALGDREAGGLESGGVVRLVPRRDLRLHERAQQLLGAPALGLGGLQHVRGEGTNPGELEPLQGNYQVRGKRRRRRAHRTCSSA